MLTLKWIVFFVALGLDTLIISTSLGLSRLERRVPIALTFAFAEGVMPLIGFLLGVSIGGWLGTYGPWVGSIAVILVGVYLLFEDDDEEEALKRPLAGIALLIAALLISVDELAVGLSIGLLGLPIGPMLIWLFVQAFLFTWIGLTFGRLLRPLLGEVAEKISGVVLILLGVYLLWELF
jgi:putative Mn2+ efflux pump MntP